MRGAPRVSCIVTTFNYAHFVTQAIDSALGQTYGKDSLEVIVVDGASTDNTPSVLEPYLSQITYIREPSNEGVVSSANRGLEAASGELIAFLNADDAWYADTVERLVERLATKPETGLVYGDMEMIDAEGRSVHPSYYEQFGIRPESGRPLGRLLRRNFIASGSFMFRAELLPVCHPIPAWAPWEDWYMAVRLSEVTDFDYLPAPVLRYRFHEANQVLMADGRRLVTTWRNELPFRRRLLTDLTPRAISAGDLVAAVAEFDAAVRTLGAAAPDQLTAALPIGETQRDEAAAAVAAASRSEQDSNHAEALFHWAHAFAYNPGDDDIRHTFARSAARLVDQEAQAVDEHSAALAALSRSGPVVRSLRTEDGDALDEALRSLRKLTARVSEMVPEPAAPASALSAMAERVEAIDHADRARMWNDLRELGPWRQGPFPVAPALRVGRATPTDRHDALLAELPDDLAGLRVLDVPSNAGYVSFALSLRGPERVVACEPGRYHHQALALERLYSSRVDFRQLGWEGLDPNELGGFDLIHADALLEGELRALPALERMRDLLADGGRLYLGFTRAAQAERSEYLRFLNGAPDGRVKMLPGRAALSWMVEVAGLKALRELAVAKADLSGVPVECGYLELTA